MARAKPKKPKVAVILDPARDEIVEWRQRARALGWTEADLDTVASGLAAPTPNMLGGKKVVCYVDRTQILTAAPQWGHRGPGEERVEGTKDEWRELPRTVLRWGVSVWRRSIAIPETGYYTQPEGTVWCQRHFRNCPHDDEGECARAKVEAAEEAKVVRVYPACRCPRGWLGDHWRDCEEFRLYNQAAASLDAMFAQPVVATAVPEAPPEPVRTIKREIDKKPKKTKGVLPGQGSLV